MWKKSFVLPFHSLFVFLLEGKVKSMEEDAKLVVGFDCLLRFPDCRNAVAGEPKRELRVES